MAPKGIDSGNDLAPEVAKAQRLRDFVADQLGIAPESVRIEGLRRLAGGASRELWSLDLEHPTQESAPGQERSAPGRERAAPDRASAAPGQGSTQRLELVLRQDPPGREGDGDRSLEFQLLRAAADSGVPVPRVHWACSDPEVLGSSFFLMDRVAGEALPRRLLRDEEYANARERMTPQLGRILAGIHEIDISRPELAPLADATTGASSARADIERIALGVRELCVEPHPVLDLAERWLLERAPEPSKRVLVHGDYRVGNVLFDSSGIRAVLDWELAHLGDPVEDLGWLCVRAWRFGNDHLPVGGLGTREALVHAYEEAGGAKVDLDALRFWEVAGNFKLALVFISQSRAFLDGVASVELASLGRRTAEAEDELLALMESAQLGA